MKNFYNSFRCGIVLLSMVLVLTQMIAGATKKTTSNPPIYISFLWHMHQPIYWPYETVVQTDQNARYPYSVTSIHDQRTGPYTTWPSSAVQKGIDAGLPHFGAQVSFSGSLIENLNNLESSGDGNFQNWKSSWNSMRTKTTSLGNPRLDMVGFGYHHPLMGLVDQVDIMKQVELHKSTFAMNFPGTYSKGIFPPENAFSPRMIPALAQEGFQWVLVDNIHFDRACQGYPFSTSGNLYEPNKADIRNPNPGDWVALNGLWAPTENSAKWGRLPHYVQFVDPTDGSVKKIIAVPADRYMGTEDARGGFGALNYDAVMSQLSSYNTDPNHPILIVLAHDGDNYGGGSESYYDYNFQSFVNWLLANPTRFVCTTVQDYLDQFPPDSNDVIHVEDGSWSGADNGDPEFLKWNGDPVNGYSPDRNSWGVVTAAKNIVLTATQIDPASSNTANAWHYMLNAEASDYWYWDFSQNGIWDSHPTRACNQAVPFAMNVIAGGTDLTPPTIYLPQREPYNPGGTEWGIAQPSDFTVWTYVFDISGLSSVKLRYRTDNDGVLSTENETYSGGSGVGSWNDITMAGDSINPETNPLPIYKALEYSAQIVGQQNVMIDYYVEATDVRGNIGRSPIRHVWVGQSYTGGGGSGTPTVNWTSQTPTVNDSITITVSNATQGAKLHWGVNNTGSSWQQPNNVYWPPNSTLFGGTGPAVETPMTGPDTAKNLKLTIGPFNNPVQAIQQVAFDIHYNDGSWNNNNGGDYHITISGASVPASFVMDGIVDTSARLVSSNAGMNLWVGWNQSDLYVATQSASSQSGDKFIFIADSQKSLVSAPWAKTGTVAAWRVCLSNEHDNSYSEWDDSSGAKFSNGVGNIAGTSILEGTVNLQTVFGYRPSKLFIAIGEYQDQNIGTLIAQAPVGNGNGNIESNEYYIYNLSGPVSPPGIPLLVTPGNNAINQSLSTMFFWHPDSGATLYHLQASIDSLFTGSFAINDSSITDTQRTIFGLAPHTRYFWRIQAKNSGGVSSWSEIRNFTTLLPVPPPMTLAVPADSSEPTADTILFLWHPIGYEVLSYNLVISSDSTFVMATIDTTLSDTAARCTELSWNDRYWWKVRAMNASGWGSFSNVRTFMPVHISMIALNVSVSDGWNMISLPLLVHDSTKALLFPQAISQAFMYRGSYAVSATLQPGTGYWLKFNGTQSVSVTGFNFTLDTITVTSGWNMIGSLSVSIPVANVGAIPGGLITSNFFNYGGSYNVATTLDPGRGYWVKVNQNGKLILSSSANIPSSMKLRMELQNETPPEPPYGDGSYSGGSGIPTVYQLEQNYPNPFNPSTVIHYSLPVSGKVRLIIYNILGQEVMRIVNEMQNAGYKSVTVNMDNLPSGLYTYRITTGTFTDVKKMVLIK